MAGCVCRFFLGFGDFGCLHSNGQSALKGALFFVDFVRRFWSTGQHKEILTGHIFD